MPPSNLRTLSYSVDSNLCPYPSWVTIQSMQFQYGPTPNSLVLQIIPDLSSDIKDPVIQDYITVDDSLIYWVYVDDYTYWRVGRAGQFKQGGARGLSVSLISPVRGWALSRYKVSKIYNSFDNNELSDTDIAMGYYTPEWGYWYRPVKMGAPVWKPGTGLGGANPLGLITAYDAILDIFNSVPDPAGYTVSLFVTANAQSDLETFIIPQQNIREVSAIQAIDQILRASGSFYMYEVSSSTSAGTLVIGKLEDSPSVSLVQINPDDDFHEGVVGGVSSTSVVAETNRVQYNYTKDVSAVRYFGRKREYLAERKRLVPAWDYWNDFKLIVRDARNMRIVPESEWRVSPKLSWLGPIQDDISDALEDTLGTGPDIWLHTLDLVRTTMQHVVSGYRVHNRVDDPESYLINPMALDWMMNPNDLVHRHRFKRFVAVPDAAPSGIGEGGGYFGYYPGWDEEIDWDTNVIGYYRNVKPVLVSGRRVRIYEEPGAEQRDLSRRESMHVELPPVVEAYVPPFNVMLEEDYNILGMNVTSSDWYAIEPISVDEKRGFFFVDNPFGKSCFMLASPTADPNQVPDLDDENAQKTKTAFAVPGMVHRRDPEFAHMNLAALVEHILVVRAPMRATFYFNVREDYAIWTDLDQIYQEPEENILHFAGFVERPGWGGSSTTQAHKFGQSIVDEGMVWQTNEDGSSTPPMLEVKHAEFITSIVRERIGRLTTTMAWTHRDDRTALENRAERALLEQLNRVADGSVEGYTTMGMVLRSSGFGNVVGLVAPNGTSWDAYPAIMSVSFDVRNYRATLEVATELDRAGDPYLRERVQLANIYKQFGRQSFSISDAIRGELRRVQDITAALVNATGKKIRGQTIDGKALNEAFNRATGLYDPRARNLPVPSIIVDGFYTDDEEIRNALLLHVWQPYFSYTEIDLSTEEIGF